MQNYLAPNKFEMLSSKRGRGHESNLVTAFKARNSTQNRNFGFPSKLFLGQVSRVRAKESDFLITPFSAFFTWDSISWRSAKGVRY
jgi:hypothetical protein